MGKIYYNNEPILEAKHKPYPYQHSAFIEIRDLDYAAIFHEQGLGKSKIAIDLILYWIEKRIIDTVLLVAKKILIANWEKELACLDQLLARGIDGLIVEPSDSIHHLRDSGFFERLTTLSVSLVLINWVLDVPNVSYVSLELVKSNEIVKVSPSTVKSVIFLDD